MDKLYDVYGIGNPLIDLLARVQDNLLHDLKIDKGVMQLIDKERREELLSKIVKPELAPGGSCANTMISLADFGLEVIYNGGVGKDEFANDYEKEMTDLGVHALLKRKSLPTGSSIILITEDTERSLNTYLGACQEFTSDDIDQEKIEQSKILYFTGYMWDTENQKKALQHAMSIAKDSDTKIFFDVADPFVVNRYKEDFIKLLKDKVDFAFANFEEAKSLTGKTELDDVLKGMSKLVKFSSIKNGGGISYIVKENDIRPVNAVHVNAIDSTGAGDAYAAGFIYGYLKNYDLDKMGRIASYTGAKVVEKIGARPPMSLRNKLDEL